MVGGTVGRLRSRALLPEDRSRMMYRSPHVLVLALAAFPILFSPACGPTSQDLPASSSGGTSHPGVDALFADLDREGPGAAVGVLLGGEVVHRAGVMDRIRKQRGSSDKSLERELVEQYRNLVRIEKTIKGTVS
jgi:CubicO group peptidase (beta-lactamase class C family)